MSHSQHVKVRQPPPATAADIERRVLEILRERQGEHGIDVTRDTRLHELGDSLEQIEALMEIEDELELSIPDADAEQLHSVGQMIDYAAAAVARREASVSQAEPGATIRADDDAATPAS